MLCRGFSSLFEKPFEEILFFQLRFHTCDLFSDFDVLKEREFCLFELLTSSRLDLVVRYGVVGLAVVERVNNLAVEVVACLVVVLCLGVMRRLVVVVDGLVVVLLVVVFVFAKLFRSLAFSG